MNARKRSKRAVNVLAVLTALALVSMAAPTAVVHAATLRTIIVDNIADDSPMLGCTLREAIGIANAKLSGTINGCTVNQTGMGSPITYHIVLPQSKYTYTLAGATNEDSNAGGDLDITADVTITGAGAAITIIDGGGKDRVFHICPGGGCGQSVTLSGMTIRNGNIKGAAGGGIRNSGGTLKVQNCTVGGIGEGNSSDSLGGGIYTSGVVTVMGSTIISNTATGDGGGIFFSGKLTVDDSIVSNNAADNGGGIYSAVGTLNVQNGSIVSDNTATGSGGGILSYGSTLTVTGSTISDNTAGWGGGIYNWGDTWGGTTTVDGSTISDNTAENYGAGICNYECTLTVQNGTIISHNATTGPDGRGGGISNAGGSIATVTGSTICDNGALYGGGIRNSDATMTVDSSTISDNVSIYGGGILNRDDGTLNVQNSSVVSDNTVLGSDGHGGGIYNEDGTTTVNGSTVISNTAQYGGGIYNFDGVTTVTGSTIISNTAVGHGGGIYSDSGTTTVNGSAVIHNTAINNGGGIYNSDTLNVQNGSTVGANTAEDGGGIYNYYGTTTVDGSTISANTATNNGGGIWNRCTGVLTVANSTIGGAGASNTANEGGGIYNDEGTTMVDSSTISNNWAAGSGGGISNGDTLTMQNSTISGNAVSGTACGGGISNGADAVVDGSTISDNWAGAGGGICTSGTLTVTDSRVLDNTAVYDGGGVSTYANVVGATSVTGSCILGNSDTSFYNNHAAIQTATGNWWGSATGPSGVGPGTGDSVSANVDYGGFLTEPILGCGYHVYLPLVLR